jgi:small subunit ribosomal protein S12
MSTLNQRLKNPRRSPKKKPKSPLMEGKPQKKVVCEKVGKATPKKPNSAKRSVSTAIDANGKKAFSFIPGEKHDVSKHSTLLIRGGNRVDLVGYRTIAVRGARNGDLKAVEGRKTSRSRYGTKMPGKRIKGKGKAVIKALSMG